MSATTTTAHKVAALKENGVKDLATISRIISTSKADQLRELFQDGEGIHVQNPYAKKMHAFLLALHLTPTGKEKASSPYGFREVSALENFGSIEWADNYVPNYDRTGNPTARTPLFNVYDSLGGFGFQYYMLGGKISIVG